MGTAVERVEELRADNRCFRQRCEKLVLQTRHMIRNSRGRQSVVGEHPLHGVEAVEPRGIESRAEESARVLRIADAARGQAQILELGIPASDWRARAETGGRVQE